MSRSIAPKNNTDLNRGVLLLWTKFGDPSLNRWRVIVRTSKWLIHTHTQATTIPGGQNWPRIKRQLKMPSAKLRPFCFGLNVLKKRCNLTPTHAQTEEGRSSQMLSMTKFQPPCRQSFKAKHSRIEGVLEDHPWIQSRTGTSPVDKKWGLKITHR